MDLLQQRAFGLFSAALREGIGDRPAVYTAVLEDVRTFTAGLSPVDDVDLEVLATLLAARGVDGPTRLPLLVFLSAALDGLGLQVKTPTEVAALSPRDRDEVHQRFAMRISALGGASLESHARFDHTPVIELRRIAGPAAKDEHRTATLLVMSGRQMGRMFKLATGITVLGRGDDADIKLDDDGVSRRHATLSIENGRVVVADCGSRNGVLVNGDTLAAAGERALDDGDRIQVGATTILKFSFQDALEEQFQDELYRSVTLDPLTGVANRRVLIDRMRAECSYGARAKQSVAVLMLDVDHFKAVNDTHGHPAGDVVLRATAQLIGKTLRSEDIVGRYGGEEFCVVLRGTDMPRAYVVAERIRKLVETAEMSAGVTPIPVTISVGIAASIPDAGDDVLRLIEAADQQLYRAKHGGRNRTEPTP